MKNVCPSFSFEINLVHSGSNSNIEGIELEEIKEISIDSEIEK
jgi:hypothetical protein